ncbi:hypothetical protein B0H10DRAFT_1950429 [Mycena sp. CBHHK59/15]|nr:hypothetical protein B0H10DRAFT_1950429 [Mycena sp. CBHHK59/15]
MLKSAHHLSSVCHLAVLRYILTHMVNAIALDVTDRDVCDQANLGMEGGWCPRPMATGHRFAVLEGLARHGDVSHTNRLDAVQGVPSRSGVSFEGFGEMGGNRWEGNKTTNNTDSGTLTLLGESKACPLSVGPTCERKSAPTMGEGPCIGSSAIGGMKRARVGRADPGQASHKRCDGAGELQRMRRQCVAPVVSRRCSRDKWKAATHAWVLESECASQADMLSGHAQQSASARCWASWQVGAWGAAAEQSHLRGHTTPYKKYYKFPTAPTSERPGSCHAVGEWSGVRGVSIFTAGKTGGGTRGDLHTPKAIEENRHGDEKSGRLEGTSGSASDD